MSSTTNLLAINGKVIGGLPIASENLKLLWENPSPTSAFAAQTVNLSASDYDFLLVVYHYYNSVTVYQSEICAKGLTIELTGIDVSNQSIYARNLTYVSDTSLAATAGYVRNTSGGTASENNGYAIPVAIYGIYKKSIANTEASHCMMPDGVTSVVSTFDGVDISSKITPASGVTISRAKKYGNIIIIEFSTMKITTANAVVTLFTVNDSTYRPLSAVAGSILPATDTDFGYGSVGLIVSGVATLQYSKVTTYGLYGTLVYGL